MTAIDAITMPKWGLAMQEGIVPAWTVDEGQEVSAGQEILDIETAKVANAYESPVAGRLRRKVAAEGETLPVGALLGVVAAGDVPDADIEAFITDFQANYVPPEDDAAGGAEPEFVEAIGLRLRYLKAAPEDGDGAATPVLFIHGFGADHAGWMFNHAEIGADRPAYALDLPGHGGSAKTIGDGSVGGLAQAVLGFLDALDLPRAHLIGHSLGGAVAATLALDQPDRVASATLIAPAGFGDTINGDFIEGFIKETRAKKLRPVLEMLAADPALITLQMVDEVLKFKRLDGATAALRSVADANFAGGLQAAGLKDRLGDAGVPIQVIWGAEDRVLPAAHAEGLPAGVKLTVIPGAGHIAHMESSSEVNDLVRAFLPD